MRLPWRKLNFIHKWLSIGDSFWIRVEDMCPPLLWAVRPDVGSVYAASVSVSLHVHLSCWFRGSCFLDVLHFLWLLHYMHFLFRWILWAPRGGIWWVPHLGLNVPRSPTLCITSGLHICPHSLQEGTSLMMAEQGTHWSASLELHRADWVCRRQWVIGGESSIIVAQSSSLWALNSAPFCGSQ